MLQLDDVHVTYGGLHALDGVRLNVGASEFVAIVGPNGAGKTTLFKAISGIVPLAGGHISYLGQDLANVPAHRRARLGIAHVPEGRQVFAAMSVEENLEMGAQTQDARRDWPRTRAQIFDMFPRLAQRRGQMAGTLSGGEQQMLAIGRGLAARPSLLMLDEPSMGLAPAIADQVFESIERIHRERGLTILLVEQRVAEALEACDRAYVIESGRLVMEGPRDLLLKNPDVKSAYLGH